jgi:hypothetical protein
MPHRMSLMQIADGGSLLMASIYQVHRHELDAAFQAAEG